MQLFISYEAAQHCNIAQMVARCVALSVYLPALSQSIVAEMQNELMKRIWLLSLLLLLLFLHFGRRFLDKTKKVSPRARREVLISSVNMSRNFL